MGQLGKLGLLLQIREEVPFSAAAIGTGAGRARRGQQRTGLSLRQANPGMGLLEERPLS